MDRERIEIKENEGLRAFLQPLQAVIELAWQLNKRQVPALCRRLRGLQALVSPAVRIKGSGLLLD